MGVLRRKSGIEKGDSVSIRSRYFKEVRDPKFRRGITYEVLRVEPIGNTNRVYLRDETGDERPLVTKYVKKLGKPKA